MTASQKKRSAKKTKTQAAAARKKPKLTLLDAAERVMRRRKRPMRCGEIIKAVLERGLFETAANSPEGCLHKAFSMEIQRWGKQSRFAKVGPGQFALKS